MNDNRERGITVNSNERRPQHRRHSPDMCPRTTWLHPARPSSVVPDVWTMVSRSDATQRGFGVFENKEERWILRCIHYSTGIFCSLSTPKKNTTGLSSCPPSTSSQRTPSRYAHTSQITHKLTQKQRSEELLALGTPQSQQQAFDNLVEVFQS